MDPLTANQMYQPEVVMDTPTIGVDQNALKKRQMLAAALMGGGGMAAPMMGKAGGLGALGLGLMSGYLGKKLTDNTPYTG